MCTVAAAPGGSWGGPCLSMADYVTGTGPTDGVTATGGGLVLAMLSGARRNRPVSTL